MGGGPREKGWGYQNLGIEEERSVELGHRLLRRRHCQAGAVTSAITAKATW